MIAEIICVGTELLMGQVLNTNAQFLSRRLSGLGVTQHRQSIVGDNPFRLKEAYEAALLRADVVITSGGLGPTGDDITKQVLAELLGKKLVLRQDAREMVEGWFRRAGRRMAQNNLAQAMFTEDTVILQNPNGTAPGGIVPCEKFGPHKMVIHLPGPPYELEPMFDQSAAPYLLARSGHKLVSRYIRIFGMGESDVDMALRDLMDGQNPSLSPYCGMGEVQLRLTALAKTQDEAEAMLAPVLNEVQNRLGSVIYAVGETDDGSLEQTVIKLLLEKGLTLAVCESLTGGMLASRLVSVPGASKVFAGGLITYSDSLKTALAGVETDILQHFGAISQECAIQMAKGTLVRTQADVAVALTGCAGPDTDSRNTPVGLAYIAIAFKDGVSCQSFQFTGSRQRIRTLACSNALSFVRTHVLNT